MDAVSPRNEASQILPSNSSWGIQKPEPAVDRQMMPASPAAGSGGTAGGRPEPGGWNRFMIITTDLDGLIGRLNEAAAKFRGEISEAGAGRARLLEDPSGNLIELFEFKRK